eukprot:EG_transcript_32087
MPPQSPPRAGLCGGPASYYSPPGGTDRTLSISRRSPSSQKTKTIGLLLGVIGVALACGLQSGINHWSLWRVPRLGRKHQAGTNNRAPNMTEDLVEVPSLSLSILCRPSVATLICCVVQICHSGLAASIRTM